MHRTQARERAFKGRASRQFEAWSHTYDRSLLNTLLFRPCHLVILEEIRRWEAQSGRACRVLDVGCGTGTLAAYVRRSNLRAVVVGLDYAPSMCRRALAKADREPGAGGPMFVAADSERLPFGHASFDMVTCSNSFHHYPNQAAVVAQMRRVLRPGGRLVLIDGFRDNVIGWFVFDVIVTGFEKHVHHATWRQIDGYFRDAGFTHIRRRKLNVLVPALATIGTVEDGPGRRDERRAGGDAGGDGADAPRP